MKSFASKLSTKKLTGRLYLPKDRECTSGVVPNAPHSTNWPWSRGAEGGGKKSGLHFCPFLRADHARPLCKLSRENYNFDREAALSTQ